MKRLLILFFIAFNSHCFSQLYVGNSSSIYVKNEVLYVEQNLNLSADSNLYLRNNAQFIQGGSTISGNTGLGSLSVYQEGTSDNFDYNYWCSPVGVPSNLSGNSNFGISLLGRPETSTTSTPAVLLPAANLNGTSVPLAIAPSWIYKLINASSYSQWILVGGASTILPGEGFTMKGTSGVDPIDPAGMGVSNNPGSAQRYDFIGKPNNGNISITLGAGGATLTGNPYPSALHLNAFLLDNDNLTLTGGTAYFWQQDRNVNSHYLSAYRGGYGSYSPINVNAEGIYVPPTFNAYNQDGTVNSGPSSGTGSVVQRRYAPIGQGFLLNGSANGNVIFKNAHRIFFKEGTGVSQFEKHSQKTQQETSAETLSYFRLNVVINNQFTRQLALAFLPEATDGPDLGIDALNMTTDLPDDVNFWISDAAYLIQGVNFDSAKKIPLAVKASKETALKFQIAERVNFDTSQPIYLYDNLSNSYHDIKSKTSEILVSSGTYLDRFFIAFADQTLDVEEIPNKNQFVIYQDKFNKNIKALNPELLLIKSFSLYDMKGQLVLNKKYLQAENQYDFGTSGLVNGVYIAEFLTADNQRITKKIILSTTGN